MNASLWSVVLLRRVVARDYSILSDTYTTLSRYLSFIVVDNVRYTGRGELQASLYSSAVNLIAASHNKNTEKVINVSKRMLTTPFVL